MNNRSVDQPDGPVKIADENKKKAEERLAQKISLRNELQSKIINKYPKL
jgi:hypothetical protein